MKIYVASSWRNVQQPEVVKALREDGHEVYDFKDSDGFSWREVDPDWENWPKDIPKYLNGLQHPAALRGFNRDMDALKNADLCVYVMPCGVSASLECGYAVGAGKPTVVYVPGVREPDLMVKMADLVTDDLAAVRQFALRAESAASRASVPGEPPQMRSMGLVARRICGGGPWREKSSASSVNASAFTVVRRQPR